MKAISLRLSTLIVVLAIGLSQSASASNPVIDWNQIALTCGNMRNASPRTDGRSCRELQGVRISPSGI